MLKLTEDQAHDGRSAEDMLGSIAEGQILLADRAYDCDALRRRLGQRQADAPGALGIPAFSPIPLPQPRRAFLHQAQALASSRASKKHYADYLALVKLAALRTWMRNYESVS